MITHLGVRRTSLVDVPGMTAATLFTHGCPLACAYCHNPRLRGGPVPPDFRERAAVMQFLRSRRNVLDAVCVTGGEPLLHDDLAELLGEIRALGYCVKLDTSGAFPDHLAALLDSGLVDMVALDVKTVPERYREVGGNGGALLQSLDVVRRWGTRCAATTGSLPRYELRTTCAPGPIDDEAIHRLLELMRPTERWFLQQYRPVDESGEPAAMPFSPGTLRAWRDRACSRGVVAAVRGA